MTETEAKSWIDAVLALPNGARFFRCALQVNPFAYLVRHNHPLPCATEAEYNEALVETCLAAKVEVIAVTDHHRVDTAAGLIAAAEHAGIHVFPGFEAETKEGVHWLCLFSPGTPSAEVEARIHAFGVIASEERGTLDSEEFLAAVKQWPAVAIAAHVTNAKGLLTTLSGGARAAVWKNSDLLACAIPGKLAETPQQYRGILGNEDAATKRSHPVAIINASDVRSPAQIQEVGATVSVKMSEVSIEGLRQAFLDPVTRVCRHEENKSEPHSELLAIGWVGGFLDGVKLHFNENLNALIGGRGTGKSTLIESIRYALDAEPRGEVAQRAHRDIVKHVLGAATQVRLLVQSSHGAAPQRYLIERTVPNPPSVRDANGKPIKLRLRDVLPGIEIYGQHEIAELSRSEESITTLLARFLPRGGDFCERKAEVRGWLEKSRALVLQRRRDLQQTDERLAALPGLQETLKSYQSAGFEQRFKIQTLLVREEKLWQTVDERIESVTEAMDVLDESLPVDVVFLGVKPLQDLPNQELLAAGKQVLEQLSRDIEAALKTMDATIKRAVAKVTQLRETWCAQREATRAEYEKTVRELRRENTRVDPTEFLALRRKIEELLPLQERRAALEQALQAAIGERSNHLVEWEDVKAEEARALEQAAKRVTKKLRDRVAAVFSAAGQREPLIEHLREYVGGQLAETAVRIENLDSFSLPSFVAACRVGAEALVRDFKLTPTQAQRIADASEEVFLRMEELELGHRTVLQLNLSSPADAAEWRDLNRLSTGQKATAVLLLLLLDAEAPLIIDQPEDDLDNRFIYEGIVPRIRTEKQRRQFVFATHDANIPVLGDAELIAALTASDGRAQIPAGSVGSIDSQPVRELIGEILEGGREAFEMRRLKYGY